MGSFIKGFIKGFVNGVTYWQKAVFHNKVPRVLCWVIALLTLPVNLITTIVISIINKKVLVLLIEEIEEYEEYEEA